MRKSINRPQPTISSRSDSFGNWRFLVLAVCGVNVIASAAVCVVAAVDVAAITAAADTAAHSA